MGLSSEQQAMFERDGLLIVPGLVPIVDIVGLRGEARELCETDAPERILERTGEASSVYITPKYKRFTRLSQRPELVECARQLLHSDVYVHQAKLNPKVAFHGTFVDWHRDFTFWSNLDGMPSDRALTAAVFLDDVDAHNAPLLFVIGSHATRTQARGGSSDDSSGGAGSWDKAELAGQSTVAGDLKYVVDRDEILEPIVSATGPAGSVVFFHSNLVHGSNHNMSPRDRNIAFVSYNDVNNSLRAVRAPRPPFIANREPAAIRSQAADPLSST